MTLAFARDLVGGPLADVPIASAAALRAHLAAAACDGRQQTVEDAALAGAAAATPGWAFAAGYQAALRRLDPAATSGGRLAALCATERGGGHPRAISSALEPRAGGGWTLTGDKTWVTLGADADVLLVVARTGTDASGRPVLRVARLPAARAGIAIDVPAPGSAPPFAPEIGHARARLEHVAVEDAELLEGDGYTRALKPFRTVEDVHVTAALVGWSIAVGRRSAWSPAWIAEAAAIVALLRTVGDAPALAAETHVALGGALSAARRLLESAEWSRAGEHVETSWRRDRALLGVASSVRAARFEASWRDIAQS